ncbi:MAG: Hydroxymethylpyrimidine ABC transporter, transmembrane component, partial [uncultured Friedmanniella sp.]
DRDRGQAGRRGGPAQGPGPARPGRGRPARGLRAAAGGLRRHPRHLVRAGGLPGVHRPDDDPARPDADRRRLLRPDRPARPPDHRRSAGRAGAVHRRGPDGVGDLHRDRHRVGGGHVAGPLGGALAVPLRGDPAVHPDPGPGAADRLEPRLQPVQPGAGLRADLAVPDGVQHPVRPAGGGPEPARALPAAGREPMDGAHQAPVPGRDAGDLRRHADLRRARRDRRHRRRLLLPSWGSRPRDLDQQLRVPAADRRAVGLGAHRLAARRRDLPRLRLDPEGRRRPLVRAVVL